MYRSNLLDLNDVLPVLDGVKRQQSGHVTATCPLCGKAGHLHLDQKDGKLLMYCQKCQASFQDIRNAIVALGARHEEPEPIDYRKIKPIEDYNHIYRNPDGTEAYFKNRKKWADGRKVFSFGYKRDDGSIKYSKPENCNNLYNLDLMAKHEQDILYIVEGEKCADAMVKAGFLATTTNTGAQKNLKLSMTDIKMLERYPVKVVIPDNDDKGMVYAEAWKGVKVLSLKKIWPDCPPKGDVSDYFAKGGTAEPIREYRFPTAPSELDREYFAKLDQYQMLDNTLFEAIASIKDASERQKIVTMAGIRASELHFKREWDKCWKSFLMAEATKGISSSNLTKFPNQPFELRCGDWQTSSQGVWRIVRVGMDTKPEYASSIPIIPAEILVNVEDETEKIRLSYFKEGGWRNVTVPRSRVANKNKIIDLADYGVEVTTDNAGMLVKYISEIVALNQGDILPRSKSIDHLGWHEDTFLPYTEDIKVDCGEEFKSLLSAIRMKGTLEEWVKFVGPLRKNIYLRLVMAASFASVLIEKVGALPFVLHLWGGTGSGKTVAMMVAASIWGNPALGKMVRTMNMTVNSMMSTSAMLRNIPFFGDELQTIKSRYENYDTLIMRVCEGVDRGRMTNATLQRTKTWSNSFIFTGEEPCTKSASGGGVKNRVIEIECTEKLVEDGNNVVNFVTGCYGSAGQKFVESLKDIDLPAKFQKYMKGVLQLANTTEKQAMAMALLLMGDELASKIFWLGEKPMDLNEVKRFLKSAFEVDMTERAYNEVLNLIAENNAKFDDGVQKDGAKGPCWGKFSGDVSGDIIINKSVLEREMAAMGFDFNACKKKWSENGYLVLTKQNRYSHSLFIGGVKTQCIVLKNVGEKENVGGM